MVLVGVVGVVIIGVSFRLETDFSLTWTFFEWLDLNFTRGCVGLTKVDLITPFCSSRQYLGQKNVLNLN